MKLLTFLPESIVGNDYSRRTALLKRQLAVMLKISDHEFKGYAVDICATLQSVFYFAPQSDKELRELTEKVTRRYIAQNIPLDFNCFLDAVSFLPSSVLVGVKVKNVAPSFTIDFVRQHAEFTAAWDILNPQNTIDSSNTKEASSKVAMDETVALLNDKSFVHEYKQFILDTQYEDEYVDNEDFPEDANGSSGSTPFGTFTEVDIALLNAFIRTPEVYEKSARKTDARSKLCAKTKMSHEQVEGWASMLKRNPNRDAILRRFTTWELNQNRLCH